MFDDNMLNELSKLKVDRKRKLEQNPDEQQDLLQQNPEEEYYEEETDEEYEEVDIDHLEDNRSLQNLSAFIGETISEKVDPNKFIGETDPDKDYSTDENETKGIIISGKRAARILRDQDGNELQSKFLDEAGNVNVVYGEPGKNIINRKSLEERRLDVKMEALSDLLSHFKSKEELEEEDNDENVIIMDQKSAKKDLKKIDQIVNIQNELEIKVSMVLNILNKLSKEIESKAGLPPININITNPDNLRSLYNKKSIDDMDVSRIFVLSLFLESPDNFPTHDTYEQVVYRNLQVGAKCKPIDLKRLITYISSDSEFNNTMELVSQITKKENFIYSGIKENFHFKCKEVLSTLIQKYLKPGSMDPMNRVNIISIKKDIQFKYRNLDSTLSYIESLKTKFKILPATLKEQVKKTSDEISATEEKAQNLKNDIKTLEKELTVLILLNLAIQSKGYSIDFIRNLPVDEIIRQLKEYHINTDSEFVQDILSNCLTEGMINQILKKR